MKQEIDSQKEYKKWKIPQEKESYRDQQAHKNVKKIVSTAKKNSDVY